MIWESSYWRSDLKKFKLSLCRRTKQKRWPDAALARCEQTIMVGFFYVRKLIESRKLSRDFADRQVKISAYPTKGEHVHLRNYRCDLDELFDMGSPRQCNIKIEELANQLIHSYIFDLLVDETGPFRGVLVASDHIRNTELLEIPAQEIIRVFELAAEGEDDKVIITSYDARKKDFVVRIASRELLKRMSIGGRQNRLN